jgi:hypothetical protein
MRTKIKHLKNVPVFRELYKLWMLFSKALGFVMSRIVFTVIYVLVIGAYAVVIRIANIFRKRKEPGVSYWLKKPHETDMLGSLRKPF